MKKFLFIILILGAYLNVFGQAPLIPSVRCSLTVINTFTDPYSVTGKTVDFSSNWDATDIVAGDSLYFLDGSELRVYRVVSISSASGTNFTMSIDDINDSGNIPITGIYGALFRGTTNYEFPNWVAGVSEQLNMAIQNRFVQRLDAFLARNADYITNDSFSTFTNGMLFADIPIKKTVYRTTTGSIFEKTSATAMTRRSTDDGENARLGFTQTGSSLLFNSNLYNKVKLNSGNISSATIQKPTNYSLQETGETFLIGVSSGAAILTVTWDTIFGSFNGSSFSAMPNTVLGQNSTIYFKFRVINPASEQVKFQYVDGVGASTGSLFTINTTAGINTINQGEAFVLHADSVILDTTGLVHVNSTNLNIAIQELDAAITPAITGLTTNTYPVATSATTIGNGRIKQDVGGVYLDPSYSATSGSQVFYGLKINPTISKTGTATGLSHGLTISPTVTAPDFRFLDVGGSYTTNNTSVFAQIFTSVYAPSLLQGANSQEMIGLHINPTYNANGFTQGTRTGLMVTGPGGTNKIGTSSSATNFEINASTNGYTGLLAFTSSTNTTGTPFVTNVSTTSNGVRNALSLSKSGAAGTNADALTMTAQLNSSTSSPQPNPWWKYGWNDATNGAVTSYTDFSNMLANAQVQYMHTLGNKVFFGGTTDPTAFVQIAAGTTSVAPLRFTTGSLKTTPASGDIEFDGVNIYATNTTPVRKTIAYKELVTTTNTSTTYTVSSIDDYVRIDATTGAQNITLPTVVAGKQLRFKRIDNNPATVITFTGTVDGSTNPTSTGGGSPIASLTSQYGALLLIGNAGGGWDVH